MTGYTDWKSEVTEKLNDWGIPCPDYCDSMLASAYGQKFSPYDAARTHQAEWLSNQPIGWFENAERCGCFRCGAFFSPDEIVWDDGIAECPRCGMDAVLPESDDYPLSEELLTELAEKQFS